MKKILIFAFLIVLLAVVAAIKLNLLAPKTDTALVIPKPPMQAPKLPKKLPEPAVKPTTQPTQKSLIGVDEKKIKEAKDFIAGASGKTWAQGSSQASKELLYFAPDGSGIRKDTKEKISNFSWDVRKSDGRVTIANAGYPKEVVYVSRGRAKIISKRPQGDLTQHLIETNEVIQVTGKFGNG